MDLSSLNEEQQAAARHTEGAVLVTAGAGSGKTRLLTHRIALLLEKGVNPYNILAITFTNKAAGEMKSRLERMCPGAADAWIMTFHACCAKILRYDISALGYDSRFTIYGEPERERLLKQVFADKNIDEDKYLKPAKKAVSDIKNTYYFPDEYFEINKYDENIKIYREVYEGYEAAMKAANALDFDDLLLKTLKLLSEHRAIREKYQDRFRYIHIDEFQDTNRIQYSIAKLLACAHNNIFIVGDEDQSIYGWRGASLDNLRDFSKDFSPAMYKLERNYRSTKNILTAANNVIKNNADRIPKVLYTEHCDGVRVERYTAPDEIQEAEYVCRAIHGLVNHGYKHSEIAILCRLNALTRPFEERLLYYNIPYAVFGGFKFYERKEIKDILAYLKLFVNPHDTEAVMRTINTPKRGIGETAVSMLLNYCKITGTPVVDAVLDIENTELSKPVINKITVFSRIIRDLMPLKGQLQMHEFVNEIIERSGIYKLYSERTEENINRLHNIDELLSSIERYADENPHAELGDFLESVTLMSDIDTHDDTKNFVTLATVHSSKGLEFKTVFIVGLEEGIFPVMRDGDNEIEEERRIMYVAVTRACERLYITRANSRFLYGSRKFTAESRFVAESQDIKKQERQTAYASGGYNNRAEQIAAPASKVKPAIKDPRLSVIGTLVRHPAFGEGRVVSVAGTEGNRIVGVEFASGRKMLALMFAPLEVADGK